MCKCDKCNGNAEGQACAVIAGEVYICKHLQGLTRETNQAPALKFFKFWFHGREQGAIGISYDQGFSTMAAGEAEAREELASKYEVYHLKLITRAFRVTLDNGDFWVTEFNGTLEEARKYYMLRSGFVPGGDSLPVKVVKVEQI